MQAEMSVGFLSFKESYVSDVVCHPNRSVEVRHSLRRRCDCELNFSLFRLLPPPQPRCFERSKQFGNFSPRHRTLRTPVADLHFRDPRRQWGHHQEQGTITARP